MGLFNLFPVSFINLCAFKIAAFDCRPQHCRLHDCEEQHCHQLQGHEPHKLVRNYQGFAVRIIHCAVLRIGARSVSSGFTGAVMFLARVRFHVRNFYL